MDGLGSFEKDLVVIVEVGYCNKNKNKKNIRKCRFHNNIFRSKIKKFIMNKCFCGLYFGWDFKSDFGLWGFLVERFIMWED